METRPPLWAKLNRQGVAAPHAWHTLLDHSADVSAVFEVIVRLPIVRARLAALAGEHNCQDVWLDRLATHVAFHDLGKANRGFQARWHAGAPLVGHVAPAIALVYGGDEFGEHIMRALPFAELARWGAFEQAFLSVTAHHGRPIDPKQVLNERERYRPLWQPRDDDDPIAALKPLGEAVQRWFPGAFVQSGPQLPEATTFWHAIAGLVMLADWIGSDTDPSSFPMANGTEANRMDWARDRAPRVLAEYGFDPAPSRAALSAPVSFGSISQHEPHEVQLAAANAEGPIVVLEAETGAGKTEAALYRFARLFSEGEVDGLYFALPTRVAATSLYSRVKKAVERLFPASARPTVVLAVPGYTKADGVGARILPDFEVQWDDDPSDAVRRSRWTAERPKRFLAGTIAVGTIDQALLGAIQVKHAHLRSACLLRHLLVVDEVHASDAYMERLLTNLLKLHSQAGGHALLLSATLGAAARTRLFGLPDDEAPDLAKSVTLPYPAISTSTSPQPKAHRSRGLRKVVSCILDARIGEPAAVATMALAHARKGAKVLVVRNTHRNAIATARALLSMAPDDDVMFRCRGIATLHHGRFAREDRALLDTEIEQQIGQARPRGGMVLIGTQTLEQSLDIDADFLITDLSPADVLLQRLGRLHRHAREDRPDDFNEPRAVVLCPDDLARLLESGRHGLGGEHGPYRDLIGLEATRRLIVAHREWVIPEMNRTLVEGATHPEALEALTLELEKRNSDWRHARERIVGKGHSEVQLAQHAALAWSKPIASAIFPNHERLATRLGGQDLAITLPDGVVGPFGRPIKMLAIPSFWQGNIDPAGPLEPDAIAEDNGRLTFRLQTELFSYDQLGLRRGSAEWGRAQLNSIF